jgi:hypothetical protein
MDVGTTTTVWGLPYKSYLEVGSLNAVNTNTGSLNVTGNVSITSGGSISGPGFLFNDTSATFSGSLSAATVTGSTITGGIVQTSASGQRVVMAGSTGSLRTYDSAGTLRGHIGEYSSSTGYATIYGVASAAGVAASLWGNRSNGYCLDIRNSGGVKNSGIAVYTGSTCIVLDNQGDGRGAILISGNLTTIDHAAGILIGTGGFSGKKLVIGDAAGDTGTVLTTKNITISEFSPSGGEDGDMWINT